MLGLLHELATERPVLCVVEDAPWVDQASRRVIAPVARRTEAERVAVVLTTRRPGDLPEAAGLPQLRLEGPPDPAALELLSGPPGPGLDEDVLERVRPEARGDPLALLELVHRSGPFALPAPATVPAVDGVVGAVEGQVAECW